MNILTSLTRRIHFEWNKQRLNSYDVFVRRVFNDSTTPGVDEVLAADYRDYVLSVSSASMAISLELALFLNQVANHLRPARILELGSGFSTLVLARAAARWNGILTSLDDHPAWANTTNSFLGSRGQSDTAVQLFDKSHMKTQAYDLVFLDLNFIEVRVNYLEDCFASCRPGGIMILDDAHKPDYLREILWRSRAWPATLYELKKATLDSFGRYSVAAVKH